MQAFSVYEESISESRAQLQAITTIIGTLQGATVFGKENYDTLCTKASLHAAKLLKKPHQSVAVQIASHLWWQAGRDPVEIPVVKSPDASNSSPTSSQSDLGIEPAGNGEAPLAQKEEKQASPSSY